MNIKKLLLLTLTTMLMSTVAFAQNDLDGKGLDCTQKMKEIYWEILERCEEVNGKIITNKTEIKGGYQISYSCEARSENFHSKSVGCTRLTIDVDEIERKNKEEWEKNRKDREAERERNKNKRDKEGSDKNSDSDSDSDYDYDVDVDYEYVVDTGIDESTANATIENSSFFFYGGHKWDSRKHPCFKDRPGLKGPMCKMKDILKKKITPKCDRCLASVKRVEKKSSKKVVTNSDSDSESRKRRSDSDSDDDDSDSRRRRDSDVDRRSSRDRSSDKEYCYRENGRLVCCESHKGSDCLNDDYKRRLEELYRLKGGAGGVCYGNCNQQSKGAQIINAVGNLGLGWGGMIGSIVSSNNWRKAEQSKWNAFEHQSDNILGGYKYGVDQCLAARKDYTDLLVEQSYGLDEWDSSMCNDFVMSSYAGYNGSFNTGFGGMANPWGAAGYSNGFMSGMAGPWGGVSGGANPMCMCVTQPCNCGNIGGGYNGGWNGGFSGGWNGGAGTPYYGGNTGSYWGNTGGWNGGQYGNQYGNQYGGNNQWGNQWAGNGGQYGQYGNPQADYYNSQNGSYQDMMMQQQARMNGANSFYGGGSSAYSPWNMGGNVGGNFNFNI